MLKFILVLVLQDNTGLVTLSALENLSKRECDALVAKHGAALVPRPGAVRASLHAVCIPQTADEST